MNVNHQRERERERLERGGKSSLATGDEFKTTGTALRNLVIQFAGSRLKNSGNSHPYPRPEVSPSISFLFFHQERFPWTVTPPSEISFVSLGNGPELLPSFNSNGELILVTFPFVKESHFSLFNEWEKRGISGGKK